MRKLKEGEILMGNFLFTILYFVIILAIMFGIMILGRKYIFSKVKINKYIPLGIAIAFFVLQLFMPTILGRNIWWVSFILMIITLTFFLWFLDIQTTGGPKKKEKEIKIVPKAKPNRVKHLNNNKNNEKK
ncbi:hypothetical protein [Clostridium celatum]|uniref:hypothetical protein n=2 Tax=Clostridium celatum TaxID=36834 RepID=UPI001898AAF2|nr:hypothetical protein [Clostridium celatum]